MISLNQLKTNVLITTDEVIFHAPMEGTVDPRSILQSIIIAERRFVKPMLGVTVYNALIAAKNVIVTSLNKTELQTAITASIHADRESVTLVDGDIVNSDSFLSTAQKALWKDYLHKITAECVYFVALPVNRSKFNTQGVTQNNPASITSGGGPASIDLKDLKHLMDRSLQDRISPLIEDMHQYLCKTGYSGYSKDCGCDSNGTAYRKKSDIILSMYDDDCDSNCRCKPGVTTVQYNIINKNETIAYETTEPTFTDIIIPWTDQRKLNFGDAAQFIAEAWIPDENRYQQISIMAVPDSIVNTTFYTVRIAGISNGRIIIS